MKLYTYINKEKKTIEDLIQKLPENWRNISGLNLFSNDKLLDMSWAGYSNYAWVVFNEFDLSEYTYEKSWFEISKNNIKSSIKEEKEKRLLSILNWNDCELIADYNTKSNLSFVASSNELNESLYPWEFLNTTKFISLNDVKEIIDFIFKYTKDVYNSEINVKNEIDKVKTLVELQNINITPLWPSTKFSNL